MKNVLFVLLFFLSQIGYAQIKELNPTSVEKLVKNAQEEKAYVKVQNDIKSIEQKFTSTFGFDDLTEEEKKTYYKIDDYATPYWDILDEGCSWYCGGGPYKVEASSVLVSEGENNYDAQNARDLNFKSAWVEGVSGYGIGEYLLYSFKSDAPAVIYVKVVNGYVKSESAYRNNARVKKLKMYIDDDPYAIFNLQDFRGTQSFTIDTIGFRGAMDYEVAKTLPDWTFKFEILEVYEGLKYDDVVISEIYFDGTGVHCFAKGTKISLSDNSVKNIEDLKIGDHILYMDDETGEIKHTEIEKLEEVVHHNLVKYTFESGTEITATQDHPFKILSKGWASLSPQNSQQYVGFENIAKIKLGDAFLSSTGKDILTDIDFLKGDQITYTISKLKLGNNFIANGFIVGVETLNMNTSSTGK